VKFLEKGDSFGEIEFFTDQERYFNAISLEHSTLLKIDKITFLEILKDFPDEYQIFC